MRLPALSLFPLHLPLSTSGQSPFMGGESSPHRQRVLQSLGSFTQLVRSMAEQSSWVLQSRPLTAKRIQQQKIYREYRTLCSNELYWIKGIRVKGHSIDIPQINVDQVPPTLTRRVIRIIYFYRLSICCFALTLALLSFHLTDLFDQFLFMLAKSRKTVQLLVYLDRDIKHGMSLYDSIRFDLVGGFRHKFTQAISAI